MGQFLFANPEERLKASKNVVKKGDLVSVFRRHGGGIQKYHGNGLLIRAGLICDLFSYGGRTNTYTVLINDCVKEMTGRNWVIERIDEGDE